MIRFSRRFALSGILVVGMITVGAPAHAQISDNFQSYAVGSLPSPKWQDAGAVLPNFPVPPFPSAFVVNTLDKHGNPTQAVSTVGALAESKGIFAFVPVATQYSLFADVRVDRYSDHPQSTTGDWAMQLSFGQNGVSNWATTPQAGIYASSLTQGWRLFVAIAGTNADIDLHVAATPGVWYTVAQSLDITTGIFHSQIWDGSSGNQLLDQFNTISGWNQAGAAQFDAFAFMAGDLSSADTYGNIGVIDNVNITTATPEPGTMALVALGVLPLVGRIGRRRRDQTA